MEGFADHFGNHAGRPAFARISRGDGSGEDDLFEPLFLFVIERRGTTGPFFPCKSLEFAVFFLESAPPVFDGRGGDVENLDDFVVVEVLEDQFATLKRNRCP